MPGPPTSSAPPSVAMSIASLRATTEDQIEQEGRTLDQRRAELDGVIALRGELVTEAPTASDAKDMQRLLYETLHLRWSTYLKRGENGESAAPFQLAGLEAALASEDESTIKRARSGEAAELKRDENLDDAQKERLAKALKALEAAGSAAQPAPKKGS